MKNKRVLEKITHTIIPHEKNNNIPHILRAEAVFVLVVFSGILFYFNQNNFKIIENLNLTATVYPAVLADLANKDRSESGISGLAWNETLEKAAKLKALDMSKNGYFAHTSPTGVAPWHWFSEAGYNFFYAGENLAIDFTESENVENAWLNSPKHRENIMNQNFTEIGIATAEGIYNGKNTTFVVEFFGKPLKLATSTNTEKVKAKELVLNTGEQEKSAEQKVAGVSVENLPQKTESIDTQVAPEIQTIEETDKFIAVKNNSVINEASNEVPSTYAVAQNDVSKKENSKLSTWYERLIVNPVNVIRYVYLAILGLVFIAILLMLKKEYQKHHKKHLAMGLALMLVMIVLIYSLSINSASLFL